MRYLIVVSIFLLSLVSCMAARVDRDIVYSARYYNPPGVKGNTTFHIYRINPDGSGKMQLTRAAADDTYPVWSPDGKKIVFLRDMENEYDQTYVYMMNADGSMLRKLPYLPKDYYDSITWDPRGRWFSVLSQNGISVFYNNKGERMKGMESEVGSVLSPDGAHSLILKKGNIYFV